MLFRRFLRASHLIRQYTTEVENSRYPRKIFSGIQPTGEIHIGNYLGAIKHWVDLQNNGENITLSIVDLHSITLPHKPKELRQNIITMAATLLACGIDPEKSIIFQQSSVPQHTELFWHLACITTIARLSRLPQFKEKSETVKDVPLGLLIYPVLQAADILLHKATDIPVGEDQLQHLQLAQELSRMFNNRFGMTFPMPHSMVIDDSTSRVKNLRNPSKKMSKSEPDKKSAISLTDSTDEIIEKFKKAVTDFTSAVNYDPENRPGVSNLITIHSAFSDKSIEDICNESEGLTTAQYKLLLADYVINKLNPIKDKFDSYMSDPENLISILQEGNQKACETAEQTIKEVRQKTGFTLDVRKLKLQQQNVL